MQSMTAFTKGDPQAVHHLPRDKELLIELPQRIQIHRIVVDLPPARQIIANPPDAPMVCPVTNSARSDARNATSPETSSGRDSRPTPLEIG